MAIEWTSDLTFIVDGERFASTGQGTDVANPGDADSTLFVWKSPTMLDQLADLLGRYQGGNIVELGIFTGGSVALVSLLARPRKLVAIEMLDEQGPHLRRFIERRGLGEIVRPYHQTDQGDKVALRRILDDEVGSEQLDLVFDDAAHTYWPARASFELLFPRLRPGGKYVLEDWTNEQGFLGLLRAQRDGRIDPAIDTYVTALAQRLAAAADDPSDVHRHDFARFLASTDLWPLPLRPDVAPSPLVPFHRLTLELVELRAEHEGLIRSIEITREWAVVERGDAEIPTESFSLDEWVADDFGVFR